MDSKPEHILLVEDDADIQLITRMSLEIGGGYRVSVCASGQEALTLAAARRPDLILLDIMMPGMDGPATMNALRDRADTASIPVIFFTANAQNEVRVELMRAGALGLIVKPIEPTALVAQVAQLWAQYRARRDSGPEGAAD